MSVCCQSHQRSKQIEKFEAHKSAGHVPEGAYYIIVINDSLLLPYEQPWYGALAELCFGDSTLPIVVDATLGSGEIDFTDILGEALSKNDSDQYQNLVMRSNFGVSINGGGRLLQRTLCYVLKPGRKSQAERTPPLSWSI